MSPPQQFFGKYRGTVVNNVDPEQRGRIQVLVPAVSNVMISSWALPCMPFGGLQAGMFDVPVLGAKVWVEFEQGDPDRPIWVGCFWGSTAEVPALAKLIPPGVPGVVIQTPLQNGISISDVPGPTGGILLKTATGAMLSISDVGITMTNGKGAVLTMVGNVVDINAGAITVI